MHRKRMWVRRHPWIVDGVAAVGVVVLTGLTRYVFPSDDGPWWLPLSVAAALCAPFPIRRQRPVLVFAIMASVAFVQWSLGLTLMWADVLLFVALFTVASRCRWQIVAVSAGVLELGAVLAVVRWLPPEVGLSWWVSLGAATVLIASMWIWGTSVRTRRAYLASLQDRAAQAERERDNQARLAADAERTRIARELHDVVSHGLSVMIVQADGAGYTIDTDPDRARQAVGAIASTGRSALAEMNRMLGVLRERDGHHDYRPQPDLTQLDRLVDPIRQAGLPVDLTIDGTPHTLPAGMELAAYRIVQEALTNTLKHAGPGVSCIQVHLSYGTGELELRVCDDGRGAAAPEQGPGQGHGLLGIRERAAVYDGTVHTGPTDGGGYEVVASLPLQPASAR